MNDPLKLGFIAFIPAYALDAAPILAFAHERLAAYKCPQEVIFTDRLPRTANGKVMRRELARWRL